MKEWENQREGAPNPPHETTQYSLENLLNQTQGAQTAQIPQEAPKQEADGENDLSAQREENSVPAGQQKRPSKEAESCGPLDQEKQKKWTALWKEKNPVRSLRRRWEQGGRDEEPDEMELIYGTRSILHPVDSGETSDKEAMTPEFGYLFERGDGSKEEEGSLSSVPPKEEQPAPQSTQEEKKGRTVPDKKPEGPEKISRPSQVQAEKEKPAGKKEDKQSTSGKPAEIFSPEEGNPVISSLQPAQKKPQPPKEGGHPHRGEEIPAQSLEKSKEQSPAPRPPKKAEEGQKKESSEQGGRKPRPGTQEKKKEAHSHPAKPESLKNPEPAQKEKAAEGKKEKLSGSRYEKLFGKAQPAAAKGQKQDTHLPEEGNKKKKKEEKPQEIFTHKRRKPAIVLDTEEIQEALQDEYEEYRRSQKKESELVEPIPAKKQKKKKEKSPEKKDRFSIFGEKEPEEESPTPAPQTLPALEDYTSPDDAFSVKADLIDRMRSLILRTVVTGIMAAVGIVATVMFSLPIPALQILHTNAYWYLALNLVLLAVSAGVCYIPMKEGIKSLLRLKGNADSAIAFASWVTLLHGIAAFFAPDEYLQKNLSVYGCLAMLGLFLNSWGKLIMVRRIYANFKFVAYPEKKQVVKIVSDESFADKLCRGMGLEKSIVAYEKPVGFLSNFLRLSYEPDPSEKLAGKLAPVGALASLAVAAMALLIFQDIQPTLAALSISACIWVPMCCVPAVNLFMRGACKRALRMGAMLVGYPGVRQFADTNAVILDAGQLYPGKNIVLHGIKGFSGERIDRAILEAGAVLAKAKSPMASTFDQIIQGKGELFPKVDSVSYEDEMGVIGWVGGRRVLVGNRKLLEEHGVAPPAHSFEEQYQQDGRQVTYLATAGELRAMFVTSYIPDEKIMAQMRRLESEGVCFLIRTCDPNVTAQMVSDHFHVYYRSVRILPNHLSQVLEEEMEEETSRAYLAIRGRRPAVMQRLLLSCIRIRNKITLSLMLQSIGVVLGFLLTSFLIIASGLAQLGTLEMLIYTLFWVLAVLIVPCIRKP